MHKLRYVGDFSSRSQHQLSCIIPLNAKWKVGDCKNLAWTILIGGALHSNLENKSNHIATWLPVCRITPRGGTQVAADDPRKAWLSLWDVEGGMPNSYALTQSWARVFGFSHPKVRSRVLQLKGADRCERFCAWDGEPPAIVPLVRTSFQIRLVRDLIIGLCFAVLPMVTIHIPSALLHPPRPCSRHVEHLLLAQSLCSVSLGSRWVCFWGGTATYFNVWGLRHRLVCLTGVHRYITVMSLVKYYKRAVKSGLRVLY